jgi:hypothetical protein
MLVTIIECGLEITLPISNEHISMHDIFKVANVKYNVLSYLCWYYMKFNNDHAIRRINIMLRFGANFDKEKLFYTVLQSNYFKHGLIRRFVKLMDLGLNIRIRKMKSDAEKTYTIVKHFRSILSNDVTDIVFSFC